MQRSHVRPALLTALLVVSAVGAVAVPAAGAGVASTPGNPPEPTTENHQPSAGANFTVVPKDHSPGTTTTYTMLSKGEGPWDDSRGLETIGYYKITTQKTRFQDCNPNNARAFGIDRGNDDPGTTTDEALLQHMESYSVEGRIITVDIYDEGDFGGSPTYLNRSDETVAQLAGCTVTPSEPGWYQFTGYVNGTSYAGDFEEVTLYSKYFYVCDCDSRQEAVETLGPPPSEQGDGGGGGSTPTATATPPSGSGDGGGGGSTPTATATPKSGTGDGGGDGGDGGSSGGGGSTPTATATPGAGDGGGASATSTATAADATSTKAATDTPAGKSSDGSSNGSGGATTTSGGGGGGGGSNDGVKTPTSSGSGPGFGVLTAFVAVAAALRATRRRD